MYTSVEHAYNNNATTGWMLIYTTFIKHIYFKTDWKFNQRQYMTFNSVRSYFFGRNSTSFFYYYYKHIESGGWTLFALWQYRAARLCVQCLCEFWLLLRHNVWVYEYSNSIVFGSGVSGRHLYVHFGASVLTVECITGRISHMWLDWKGGGTANWQSIIRRELVMGELITVIITD